MTNNETTLQTSRPRHYWLWHTDGEGNWSRREPPPGEDLAALRSGIDQEAGGVPKMWRFYTTLSTDGRVSAGLFAEHLTLTLFGVHQQSKIRPMHRNGVGLGDAVRELRTRKEKYSENAIDRRFAATAEATSLSELGSHLRGLVTLLRGIDQPLDYTRLFDDLRRWQNTRLTSSVRRRWGAQYFGRTADQTHGQDDATSASPTTGPGASS